MDLVLREDTPLFSDAAIRVLNFTVAPHGLCIRAHWHDRIEFLLIREGEMILELGSDRFTAVPGQLIIIPPQVPHHAVTDNVAVHYDVLIFDIRSFYNKAEICQRLLPPLHDGRAVLRHITENEEIIACVDALCHRLDHNSLLSVAMVYQLLSKILEHCVESVIDDKKTNVVKEIADYIESHFTQNIDTALLCQQFGYTAAHLCRKFKAATGLSPMNYLKIYRLEQARNSIINSRDNISEIAARCGYVDSNYFTRCFTAHFGVPPTYYRKSKVDNQ